MKDIGINIKSIVIVVVIVVAAVMITNRYNKNVFDKEAVLQQVKHQHRYDSLSAVIKRGEVRTDSLIKRSEFQLDSVLKTSEEKINDLKYGLTNKMDSIEHLSIDEHIELFTKLISKENRIPK